MLSKSKKGTQLTMVPNLFFFAYKFLHLNGIYSRFIKCTWHFIKVGDYTKAIYTKTEWAFVVTSTQKHWIIQLFNIIEMLNKFKLFQDHRIRKFSNNIDMRKVFKCGKIIILSSLFLKCKAIYLEINKSKSKSNLYLTTPGPPWF